jgi:hypothetical protein
VSEGYLSHFSVQVGLAIPSRFISDCSVVRLTPQTRCGGREDSPEASGLLANLIERAMILSRARRLVLRRRRR